jgi:hypothetical protein
VTCLYSYSSSQTRAKAKSWLIYFRSTTSPISRHSCECRGEFETAQELINAFPTLEQAALNLSCSGGNAGQGLTEQDRRRLLDLPDAEEETAKIHRVNARSRTELVSTVYSRPGDLSDAELELLKERFWADVTSQENRTSFYGRGGCLSGSPRTCGQSP